MATNPEFRSTVLIGLGGSGQLILMHLKRLFLDTYGVVPPSIKLLALDTDATTVSLPSNISEKSYTLDREEYIHLKVEEPRKFIEETPSVGKWYVKPLPLGALTAGAGGIRQNGRLALIYHINEVRRRLDKIVTDLNDVQLPHRMANTRSELGSTTDFTLSERDPEVFVCGSLAGGTGSGIFLDMGILLRAMLPKALIHGFFLLQWIYRNKAFAYRIDGNVYAALSELDNLQSITYGAPGFVPYSMEYGDLKVSVQDAPYTLFHVIDGRNEAGQNIDNVQRLCEVISEAVFLSVGAMSLKVASVVDNLLAHINVSSPRVWGGRFARYSSVGVSSIYYPARELRRLTAFDAALKLCRAASAEMEDQPPTDGRAIDEDLALLLTRLNLSRTNIRNGLCPNPPLAAFQAEKYEIADREFPAQLRAKWQGDEAAMAGQMETIYRDQGAGFLENTIRTVRQRFEALQADHRGAAYLRAWTDQAGERFRAWSDEASREIQARTTEINDVRADAENLLDIAARSRYLPFIGGPRKSAAENFAQQVERLLDLSQQRTALEQERQFHDAALAETLRLRPASAPAGSDVLKALADAESILTKSRAAEQRRVDALRANPTHILIGNGEVIITPGKLAIMRDKLVENETYDAFKTAAGVHRPEDYLALSKRKPEELAAMFSGYTMKQTAPIAEVGVRSAMETIAAGEPEGARYIEDQIGHLFRLSSPMWSFSRGSMNPMRDLQYGKIINLGCPEGEEGERLYGQAVKRVQAKHHIVYDPSFSTTGDPYTIWLLDFAAALPLYFIEGMNAAREKYEEEITPTYHVDRYFEMNVPDLFPVDDVANVALRVLGMAIVPAVDVIHDEKLTQGHKFTCDAREVTELNNGQALTWREFRKMYSDVKDTYDPKAGANLLDILSTLVRGRIGFLLADGERRAKLRDGLASYVKVVQRKLETRDFSRLVSAKLTYREIQALQEFLEHMDIDRYIAGKEVSGRAASPFARLGR